ncbi:MAG: DNA-directed RNA polymerase subunit alpha [candidate division WOR-3 bacterium]
MKLKPFILPEKIEVEERRDNYFARFSITPFEKGWGQTIGNSLRRALLSSVQGAAITQVRISDVDHEFSAIPDVLEDVPQIILNIKKIRLRLNSEVAKFCYLHARGKGTFRAKDMTIPPEIIIVNPEQEILTITDEKGRVDIEMKVENGRGYVPQERLKKKEPNVPLGTIFLDAFFSPVKRVAFTVENTRVLDRADFEKLILEVETDGTVFPEEAIIQAAAIVKNHMEAIIPQDKYPQFETQEKYDREKEKLKELLPKDIQELGLSSRALNALKKGRYKSTHEKVNINTVGELLQLTERDILDIENVGEKTLEEIKKALEGWGLSLGMKIEETGIYEAREGG